MSLPDDFDLDGLKHDAAIAAARSLDAVDDDLLQYALDLMETLGAIQTHLEAQGLTSQQAKRGAANFVLAWLIPDEEST